MLGTVGFDGYSRTTAWQNLAARVEAPYIVTNPRLGELLVTGLHLLGLLVASGLVAAAFLGACAVARDMVNTDRSLAADFVLSLVPIAFVYEVAHYFSLFLTQGQFALPLLSDPFGRGWDVLGHRGLRSQPGAAVAEHRLVRPGRALSSPGTSPGWRSRTTER